MLVDIVRKKEISEKHKIASNEVMVIHRDVFLNEYEEDKDELTHLFFTSINYIFGYCFKERADQFLNLDKNIIDVIYKALSENLDIFGVILYGAIYIDDKENKRFAVNYILATADDFNPSYALISEGEND